MARPPTWTGQSPPQSIGCNFMGAIILVIEPCLNSRRKGGLDGGAAHAGTHLSHANELSMTRFGRPTAAGSAAGSAARSTSLSDGRSSSGSAVAKSARSVGMSIAVAGCRGFGTVRPDRPAGWLVVVAVSLTGTSAASAAVVWSSTAAVWSMDRVIPSGLVAAAITPARPSTATLMSAHILILV